MNPAPNSTDPSHAAAAKTRFVLRPPQPRSFAPAVDPQPGAAKMPGPHPDAAAWGCSESLAQRLGRGLAQPASQARHANFLRCQPPPRRRHAAACLLAAVLAPAPLGADSLFEAAFNQSTAVSATLQANASPANLNAGTAAGSWLLTGTGGGNPGAVIANSTRSDLCFCFDSVVAGDTAHLATGVFTRPVNLAAGEGLTLEFSLYASRQGTGRQVRLSLQNAAGTNAHTIAFALDTTKAFAWLDTAATTTTLATAGTSNSGYLNPAVDNYLAWSSGTMIRAKLEIDGAATTAGTTGAKLSVDWNGDGDFTDANEILASAFGPRTAGVTAIDRFELHYGGSTGNRGIYLDNLSAQSVPPATLATYHWTGSASGGDNVSLYQEANWSLEGDNVTLIPQINPATPLNLNLVVTQGTPGGSGATGTLDLGSGNLTVNGGTVRMNASSGITGGTITQTGGTIEALFLQATTATLTAGTLRLGDSGDALRTGATVDLTATSTATIAFPNESPANVIAEHLAQITVAGQAAAAGVNLAIASDGAAGSLLTRFSGDPDTDDDGMNDAWETTHFNTLARDGSGDFDQDNLTDLAEFQAGTHPTNRDSDGDTLPDGAENKSGIWTSLAATGTHPLKPDSDADGLPDHLELNHATDPNNPASKIDRPNIIFVLCDDLGYGDLGAFFQNQRAAAANPADPWHLTPRIDTLAAEGIQLRGHYCPAPVCAPSRASLLLGVHQGHANVRDNQFDKALEDNHTLATVLRSAGYATFCIGKWGLQGGATFPAHPINRGFDGYFGYLSHGAGHAHYPKEDAQPLYDGFTDVRSQFDKCYTTDLFTARAKKFLTDQRAAAPAKPFFLYLAYDTPHAELQLPTSAFPAGAGLTGGLQWTGSPGAMINTAAGTVDSWFHPAYASATWDDPAVAGTTNPWPDVYRRYATSVRRIDDCLHDLIQTLKDLGIDHNTLVVFSSDNGPSKESYLSGTDANGYSRDYAPTFFESYGPFDGIKRDLWEGGIRVGAIARWPGAIPAGQVSNSPSQFHDWMPTFAEIAKTPCPARSDGVSLVPTLTGSGIQRDPNTYVEYFEGGTTPSYTDFLSSRRGRARNQMQMIRLGDLVGVRYNITSHSNNFEIYNVVTDPGQTTNLAAANPALQQQMKDRVLQSRRPDTAAARPYDAEPVPPAPPANPALVNGLRFRGHHLLATSAPDDSGLAPAKRADSPVPDLSLLPRPTHCTATFEGWLQIPADGTWTFHLTSNTRALVRLHSAILLDADAAVAQGTSVSTSIPLKAGLHPLRIACAHGSGPAPTLTLEWAGTGVPRQNIPASALFIDDGDDDADTLAKSQERARGTSDYSADTDGDGLTDASDFDPVHPNTPPVNLTLSNQNVPENVPAAAIGDLSAADPDAGDLLSYSFAAGAGDADNASFSITGNRLALVTTADFETKPSYHVRIRATDRGGATVQSPFTVTVTNDAIGLTAAEWHQNHFGNAPPDWGADDDHDGLDRLLEYAFGGDPHVSSASAMPALTRSGDRIHLHFTRRASGFHDLVYQVESSADLLAWQPATLEPVSVTPGPAPELEQVVLAVPQPPPASLHLRLRVTFAGGG